MENQMEAGCNYGIQALCGSRFEKESGGFILGFRQKATKGGVGSL